MLAVNQAWALHTAIVGAGLAGLSAAHRLSKFGIAASVFDAQRQMGGRVRTTEIPELNLTVEAGGAFINLVSRLLLEVLMLREPAL